MEANLQWLDDPTVFRVNQLPAHSDHQFFKNQTELEAGQSSYVQSLNGTWDFAFAENPQARPVNFWEVDADRSKFTTIEVPSEIELQDFSQINYINTLYPWSGKIYRRPAYVVGDDEAAGSFAKELTIQLALTSASLIYP